MIISNSSINAFSAQTANLYITSGAFKKLNEREVISIFLHEYGHYRHKDTYTGFALFTVLMIFFQYKLYYVGKTNVTLERLFLTRLVSALGIDYSVVRTVLNLTEGRYKEFRADSYATKFGYGEDLITALKKMKKEVAREYKKLNILEKLEYKLLSKFDEHPDMDLRIEKVSKDLKSEIKGKTGLKRIRAGLYILKSYFK